MVAARNTSEKQPFATNPAAKAPKDKSQQSSKNQTLRQLRSQNRRIMHEVQLVNERRGFVMSGQLAATSQPATLTVQDRASRHNDLYEKRSHDKPSRVDIILKLHSSLLPLEGSNVIAAGSAESPPVTPKLRFRGLSIYQAPHIFGNGAQDNGWRWQGYPHRDEELTSSPRKSFQIIITGGTIITR